MTITSSIPNRLSGNAKGMVYVIVGMMALTLEGSCNKVLALLGFNPEQMVLARVCVMVACLLPMVLFTRGKLVRIQSPSMHLTRGLFVAISAYGMAYAVVHLPLAEANTYLLSCTLFMLPLGALFLGERAHWLRWVGMAIGFVGVLLILRPGFSGLQLGAVAALSAALAEAALGVCLKKLSHPDRKKSDGPYAIIFWSCMSNLVVFGCMTRFQLPALSWTSSALILLAAVSGLGIFLCYILAYQVGEASAVEAGSFSMLLFSPLFGYLGFGEIPPSWFWLGALVMTSGILLIWFEPRRINHLR